MTDIQKEKIMILRKDGYSYKKIATILGVSDNTIKSFCRRNGLTGVGRVPIGIIGNEHFCLSCGVKVEQTPGRKEKKFCSDACRMRWWNSHQDKVNRKAVYEFECAYCKKTFKAYGNAKRKYCSHPCYVMDRFGGGYDD